MTETDDTKARKFAKIRATVYGVFVAAQPVLIFYGLSTEAETSLWLTAIDGVFAAFVGTLAFINVTPSKVE